VLNLLAANHAEQFTISEIAQRLAFNLSTCHSMLNELVNAGVLVRNPHTKRYALGPTLVTWGMASAFDSYRVLEFAEPEMSRLRHRLGVSCEARALVGQDTVVLARRDTDGPIASFTPVGYRLPAVPPIGAEFLAWESDAVVDEWLDRPAHPLDVDDRARMHDLLADIRRDKYRLLKADLPDDDTLLARLVSATGNNPDALGDHLFELLQGLGYGRGPRSKALTAVTAPIFGADATPVLTLLLTFGPSTVDVAVADRYLRPLVEACQRITRTIGGRLPS
jgi:DNA-binding IclR family transcriptional regulator